MRKDLRNLALATLVALVLGVGYVVRGTGSGCDAPAKGAADLEAGHLDAAIVLLGQALRDNPNDATARLELARAYKAHAWDEEARKQFELSATGAKETLKGAYLGLSILQEKKGNHVDAERLAKAAQAL